MYYIEIFSALKCIFFTEVKTLWSHCRKLNCHVFVVYICVQVAAESAETASSEETRLESFTQSVCHVHEYEINEIMIFLCQYDVWFMIRFMFLS